MSSTTVKPTSAGKQMEQLTSARKDLGVCSTCRHLARCLFVEAARQPIWECEEFDDSGAADAAPEHAAAPPAVEAKIGEQQR